MAVAPDPLLRSAPQLKPKASAGKAPEKPAEPRKNEASSFAQVYAKERQAKAAERSDASAKPHRPGKAETQDARDPQVQEAAAVAQQPEFADSGKLLPSDAGVEEPALDPLLALGSVVQQSPDGEAPDLDLDLAGEPQPMMTAALPDAWPSQLPAANADPELDALDQLPAVRMALELGAKAKAAVAEQSAPGSVATQTAQSAGQSFASALAAMGSESAEAEADVPVLELTAEGLQALKESAADTRPENFVARLSALSQAVAQQTAQAPRAGLMAGQPVPMQQAGWSEAVVDRVMLLSSQNLKSAEIQLDPAELGRLEVRISVNQEQTQVTFASAHAGVRDALEGQMHRLREMFTQQGMNLLDVNVSDQSLGRGWQGQEQGQGRDAEGRGAAGNEQLGGVEDTHAPLGVELNNNLPGSGRGMVDYYA
ncbi:flagellar hook-length control protein FliK [Pseudomonas sp. SA3-5]|uniref:Flagellar hook-length control protein FliK n=1 Tax=Pseudomonas aestuarii TaxID=3018340 RepID=A0ABT4XCK9_9PSED|nr:flagellar hook-length control protein FliK [Pseudomonas aestuarii]MDA7085947.1 flagellar hook-length control protein FliK [Pseudomonas aestuarii]